MDTGTSYCLNRRCELFGKVGAAARWKGYDWQRTGPRFECEACGRVLSASTGTAYAGVRTDLNTYRRGARALAEGVSIRATSRLIEVDKDTVQRWLPILGQHAAGVMTRLWRLSQPAPDRVPVG
jgi:hypothetical protein